MQRLQLSADDLSTAERPSVASTITALLKLCSSNKADIEINEDGIKLVVQGGPASVQPTRRGRGAGSRGAVSSLLWPDGFTWSLTVRLTDAESLVLLCDPPELLCTCSTCEDTSKPFQKAAAALKFMDAHSGHNSSWSKLLNKHEPALEQDLNSLLQQVQQHTDEGLVLPLQRAAALICVEAAHMILLSDELLQQKPLKQLAYTILHHRIIWHMTSSHRPARQDDFQQLQLAVGPALAPHLLWLIAGAPPYGQTTSAAPETAKSSGLEARALVAYLRRCHLFQQPGSKKGSSPYTAPNKQQMLSCLQQLLLLQQGSSNAGPSASSAAASGAAKALQQQDVDEDFINDLLALRGLQLQHLVDAAEEAGSTSQLDFCVLCGSSSSTTQERLMHCKSCCHSYHAHCALATGNADGSYTMQTYTKVREGVCLGCQHFPLRTEAEGGLPWDSAAEDAEVEAAAAAAAGAAKHLARVKGTSNAMKLPGASAIAAAVAAATAATSADDDDETAGNSSSSGEMPGVSPAPAAVVKVPAKSAKPPLAASAAVNAGSGAAKNNKHLIRGPNGKFVSLKQQPVVKEEVTPSRSGGTAAPAGSTAAAGDDDVTAAVPDVITRAGSIGVKPKRLSSASAADDSALAAAAAAPPAAAAGNGKGANGKVILCCQPLIPGSEAPEVTEPTDIEQVCTYVLDRLIVLSLAPGGDSGMLLRRALLKEGLRLDYVDNLGQVAVARFEVVTAAAGRKGEKQQLLCHACGDRYLATCKEAEDHLNYDSGGHSTQFLKFVGTKVSVKELWEQVKDLYKQKMNQQHAPGKQLATKQQPKPQAKPPQQQGKNPTASPAMDAAHALHMLATACEVPFGAAAGGGGRPTRVKKEQQQRKRRAEAALSADDSSLDLPDHPPARKRRHIERQRRASSSNVSDTITAPLGDGSPPDEARSNKRRRLLLLLEQQQTPDPLVLRWRLARVPVVFRQHLDQLLSTDSRSLQLLAFLVEFWALDSSSSGGPAATAAAAVADGDAAPEAASGNSSPAATTTPTTAPTSSVVWDMKSLESDGVVELMAGAAKASLSSSSSSSTAFEAAAEIILEACLEAIKALYSEPSDQQQQQEGLNLLSERRQLLVSMLQLGLSSLTGSSGSSGGCAALLDVAAVAVCSSTTNAQQLQQLLSICDMLQELLGLLSQQVWPALGAALQKHLDEAAADEDRDQDRSRDHRRHDDDQSELSVADDDQTGVNTGQTLVLRALQQLLDLVMHAPAAWDAALIRKCSSSSSTLTAGSSSMFVEVMFEAIYQACVLQEQYAAEQAKLQEQQQREEELAAAAAAAMAAELQQQEQPQPSEDVMPMEGQQQQQQLPGKVAQGSNAALAGDGDDDVMITEAGVDQQQQPQQQEVDSAAVAAASPSEVEQQQQQGDEEYDDVVQVQDVDTQMTPEAVDLTEQQQVEQQQQDEAQAEEPLTAEARQERRKAAEDLLEPFTAALTAAATWLASTQKQQQVAAAAAAAVGTPHKAEDLLVGMVWLQYQVLRVLLLTDTQLRNVLQFVAGGLQKSLVDYAADSLKKATAAFTATAAAGPAAASTAAVVGKRPRVGGNASSTTAAAAAAGRRSGGSVQQQVQEGNAAADCGLLAYDIRYIGDTLAETVGRVVKNKRAVR